MAQILQRVFAVGGNQKYLTLNNQEYTRRLECGNDWTVIRIGILAALPTNGTAQATRLIRLGVGMCSDLNGGFNAASTAHWVGWRDSGIGGGANLSYNANSGSPYYTISTSWARKVGTTITTSGIGTIQAVLPASTDTVLQRKLCLWVEITRSYSFVLTACSSLHGNIDCSYGNFLQAIENVGGTPTVGGQNMSNSTPGNNISGDDGAGELNTLSIYWGSEVFPLEVYGMAVYRAR